MLSELEKKAPLLLRGMHGLGDSLHQRALLRQLMQRHDVWLEGSWVAPYHDLIADGLHVVHKATELRTQAKNATRERRGFDRGRPPNGASVLRNWYSPEQVRRLGSVLKAMCETCHCDYETADFRLPVPDTWKEPARRILQGALQASKPLMIYRPPVERPEWGGAAARNPDVDAYAELFNLIRDRFYVVSIADFEPKKEWLVGPACDADVKYHKGELSFESLAALTSMAALVFTCPGFPVVLSQAVGTPHVVVFGGYEDSRSFSGGARYVPYLGIDPIIPCQCFSHSHNCQKAIDMPIAKDRLLKFLGQHAI